MIESRQAINEAIAEHLQRAEEGFRTALSGKPVMNRHDFTAESGEVVGLAIFYVPLDLVDPIFNFLAIATGEPISEELKHRRY